MRSSWCRRSIILLRLTTILLLLLLLLIIRLASGGSIAVRRRRVVRLGGRLVLISRHWRVAVSGAKGVSDRIVPSTTGLAARQRLSWSASA